MLMSVIGNFKTPEMLKLIGEIYGKAKPGIVERPDMLEWGTGFAAPKLETKERISHRFYKGDKTILQQFYSLENQTADFYTLLSISLDKQKKLIKTKLNKLYPEQVKDVSFEIQATAVRSFLQANLVLNSEQELSGISNYFEKLLKGLNLKLSKSAIKAKAIKSKSTFLKQIEKPHMFGIYNASLITQNGLGAIIEAFSGEGIIEAGKALSRFEITAEPRIIIQHSSNKQSTSQNAEITVALFENNENQATVIAKQNQASNLLAIHYMFKYKSQYQAQYGKDLSKKWHDAFGNRMKSPKNQQKSSQYGLSFVVNDNAYIPMDNIYLSPTFGYIRVEGLAEDVNGAIQYLNNEMLKFVPTEEEFNAVNKSNMSMMMGGKDNSKTIYDDSYDSLVMEDVSAPENAKEVDYATFLAFGKNYFAPSNQIISVVSKADPKMINQQFSGYKSDIIAEFKGLAKERGFKTQQSPVKFKIPGGGEQSHTFYGFVKDYEPSDEAALTILSLILRDDIIFNIREQQGLAYRMTAGISKINGKALFYTKIPTLPQNLDKLVPQLSKLFYPELANDITAIDLEKTINMHLGRMMFRRLSSINQAYYLAHSYYFDGNIESDQKSLDALKKVSLEDVKRVARKYLKDDNAVEIVIH
ncbi:MAG: hypothetical protein DRQ47_01700 [Gammaproteobacteria bacterium]|nr:MAG: hypothetical protein DRQ47_01700 [Gammaproteobacteria bacterium]